MAQYNKRIDKSGVLEKRHSKRDKRKGGQDDGPASSPRKSRAYARSNQNSPSRRKSVARPKENSP